MAMAERKNIEFGVEGGVTLRGWLFVPAPKVPARRLRWRTAMPGVKEHGLGTICTGFRGRGAYSTSLPPPSPTTLSL